MKSEIILIRHGITEGNLRHWYYGWTDVPLLEEGRKELVRLRKEGIYPNVLEDAPVFRSEFKRTLETLRILYGDRKAKVVPELDEYNFGRFEAMTVDQFKDEPDFIRWKNDKTGTVPFAGGDSTESFRKRVGRGIRIVLDAHNRYVSGKSTGSGCLRSLAVIHGGVISQMLRQMFPDLPGTKYDWVPEPGLGFSVQIEGGKPVSFTEIRKKGEKTCRTSGKGYPVVV
ncbi:MAG: histidine phosphatase family protein [Eubacteriales bacterium]|nr:histidine phosphatase family protein [Eubacteriales bacterium]